MGSVVLLANIVEVLSMLADLVVTDHVLEEFELVVVLVVDARGIEEHTDVCVVHLIITHHEKRGNINALVAVGLSTSSFLSDGAEGLTDLANKGIVIDGTSTNDNDVITAVVVSLEGTEHVSVEVLEVVRITADRLAHHVVTEGVVVAGFEGGGPRVLVQGVVLLGLLLLGHLELSGVESGVGNGVTKKGNSTTDVTLEAGHVKAGHLTLGGGRDAGTHALTLFSELSLGCTLAALEEHLSEEVGRAGSLKGIVTGAGTDVDTNAVQ